ncbi:MAG: hypothetical protein JNL83_24135 [Myxococcales bacterium]|nr:hypothetical protein [Myxococcales bacterium]
MRQRLADWIVKYRYVLFAAWLIHVFYVHYFLIGFLSWDGFGHRGFPIIELFQHGDLGKDKFNEWSLVGYTPFVELAHLPFLWLFELRGLIIGFPLVVLPLCVYAVYALAHELTGDKRAATFSAFAYAAIPLVNQQPFTCYIDFSVIGILAYWLYALVRVRRPEGRVKNAVRLVIATFLFTMSRSQGPYVLVVVFPLLAYALFLARDRWKLRIADKQGLRLAVLAIAVGMAPAIAVQIHKYLAYGSPIAPMQLSFLGLKIGTGVPVETYFQYAGLGGTDVKSLLIGFWNGWVWHAKWPLGAFYASQFMAAGLLFHAAVLLLPVFLRHATRLEKWVLGSGLLVSLLTKDFAIPRMSYTLMLAIALVLGRSLAALAATTRWRAAFFVVLGLVVIHLLRPEFDLIQLKTRKAISPQLNVVGSKHFIDGGWEVPVFPDHDYQLAIVQETANHFVLQMYGKRLSNEIVGTVPAPPPGDRCASYRAFNDAHPDVLYVDDLDLTKDCQRECVIKGWRCFGWRITP